MKFGSLFSGVGAFDLGFHLAGWDCRWQVEVDDYCRQILELRFPWTTKYGDIKNVKAEELETVDAIVGGFPCQPVSFAGKLKGESDERWLWKEFARVAFALRPTYIVIENVRGLLNRGGTTVLFDIAKAGYDAEWQTIPASAFGANHKRERLFIVAYDKSVGMERLWSNGVEITPTLDKEILSVRDSDGEWKVEPDIRRTSDGNSFRVDRLKSIGNAVVPHIGHWLARQINGHLALNRWV